MDAVNYVVRFGYHVETVLDMPYDSFLEVSKSVGKILAIERQQYCVDTASAIAGALSGKGLKEYIESLAPEK